MNDYRTVEQLRDLLELCQYRSRIDTDNLESLLNLIETAQHFDGIEGPIRTSGTGYQTALLRLIAGVLQETQVFTLDALPDQLMTPHGTEIKAASDVNRRTRFLGPQGYDEVARMILTFASDARFSFITFNYDLGLEIALTARGIAWTHSGIVASSSTDYKTVQIIKPHGTLGLPDDQDGSGLRQSIQSFVEQQNSSIATGIQIRDVRYRIPLADGEVPRIVPPSENKLTSREQHRDAWHGGMHALRNAQIIAVAGYSLPPTDQFVRHWFALAGTSAGVLRRVFLCDRDPNAIQRWRDLFGLQIGARTRVLDDFRTFCYAVRKDYLDNDSVWS
ncbi:MAG TPA: hypothetical protein VK157_05955 [Phycisphaerales bacterium]|nr:hypothetical protein [Phycisphaerales bacterium]